MSERAPYHLTGPALISFSGGRSSRYMLKQILDAHGGTLPDDVKVAFANTGREFPETLDFVAETAERYGVHIAWLEYDPASEHRTAVVSHNSASRNGEPFALRRDVRHRAPARRPRGAARIRWRER
ncbi:phosphoadenosine phosphosulfate reductase family protein [Rhodopseudomonas palustris]|uniref:phosphoadenosine phosphosulfate reductase domain-containing protein n=1 Tax=Rhodopseudomonas palustris TaxID=1076 RepID=UPI0022F12CB0|nr:phosphoadenosine phosphosulfate reductase family protein [Rhodopseudomonas palustris]WBU27637.1 phosphoadenosine phosphosulfate reductase family protein [Rhodopseudomonas palustris]